MPIFSNRSLRRMLDTLAPSLMPSRVRELERKISRNNEQTIPAEWEIAVGYALLQAGTITDPGDGRPGNLDFLFQPHGQSETVIVEVTCVSDRAAKDRNPVDEFSTELRKSARKYGLDEFGGLHWGLGDVELDDGIVLGIPAKNDMVRFFKSPSFVAFVKAIKGEPGAERRYEFQAQGSRSVIVFRPGKSTPIGGGHRSFNIARKPQDAGILRRLMDKERQLSRSKMNMPAIVFLCDNDSYVMKTAEGGSMPGMLTIGTIVGAFFDGLSSWNSGAWIQHPTVKKGAKRIHLVVALAVKDAWSNRINRFRRGLKAQIFGGAHTAGHMTSPVFVEALNCAINSLPASRATAANALKRDKWPRFYGGGSMSMHKVKISLGALQQLLVGKISQADFAKDHEHLANHLQRLDDMGLAISDIEIQSMADEDDDWVELTFDSLKPEKLFPSIKL